MHQLVVDYLVFLAVGLVDGERVARLLKLNKVISDVETGSRITRTHKDDSLERRVDGGRGEVGGDRNTPRTVPPAVLRAQY